MRVLAVVLICTFLTACGAVALPFRVTADVARVVPVAGDVVAAPLDATGDAIDRSTTSSDRWPRSSRTYAREHGKALHARPGVT